MSNNILTCDFMDEAPGHDATEHTPHPATPDYGSRVEYEDGDIERSGYACFVCRHITDGLFHTDPRLDPVYAFDGPATSDLLDFSGGAASVA